ncbi:MAG TPA: signal recognition particle-docking protein FtsY [Syntrophales bacterium]|nr:signal recognition particle-docking protein FtsY [Syntrophales bacterium]HOL59556.1 signal recognition particle-docking protein FtsY [Syntrophales bacterium]HPO35646.1 signal recognition particle-docking protein FtsY [Syntrophales bacterium]
MNFLKGNLIGKFKKGLSKTRELLFTDIEELVFGHKEIDEKTLEELEEALIRADVGPSFTEVILKRVKEAKKATALGETIKEEMRKILLPCECPLSVPAHISPFVIMVVGVNGTGKTTTIGKLAFGFQEEGLSVLLVAADTFRAAAIEQLSIWGERAHVPVIKQKANADPAAVVFDGLNSALANKIRVVLVDTAGRLHTKVNLMEELKKIKRVMSRVIPGAPHEVLLVMDATTGQNGIAQANMFHEAVGVTGIALTKLDGTAKGGVIVRIASELSIPIRFIGVGEGIDDLKPFSAGDFVEALFERPGGH